VDLHAVAWHGAMVKFGHDVSFEQARSQIGKGGNKLIPVFLSEEAQRDHGQELDAWRSEHFKVKYLPLIRPFSAVPDLLKRSRAAGLRIAIASSAKKDELEKYLDIAGITKLVDATTSSDEVAESKPEPDIFEVVLKKLKVNGEDAVPSAIRRMMQKRQPRRGSARSEFSAAASPRKSFGHPDALTCIPAALFACFPETLLAK
jgi:phosphoglycolate phosphatase-like HAD superfamily hydrolase